MTGGRLTTQQLADASLAALVVLIVGMMIVPLPTWILDVLLASNIAIAVLMLLVAIYLGGGLSFTAFPTILLVTTLYRLALNVSSTRLILLQADAGHVIDAFGNFVVQGNYVVGAVVFLILTLIQFMVVAKGSERVAEVGARFALDAMPGKQMSIDAELRSGALSQDEAATRRADLQRESQFYGAMDGAMKFVKGDAIAGIVITCINILGGLGVGVGMREMGALESLQLYGLLTIGDGLVSQIPALLISTAAGLVVTRVASEGEQHSLGGDVAAQVFGNPKALAIAAVFLVALAITPGLPFTPFVVLAGTFALVARRLHTSERSASRTAGAGSKHLGAKEIEAPSTRVPLLVPIAIELGPALARELLEPASDGTGSALDRASPLLRDRFFLELGVTLPNLRTRAATHLPERAYRIYLHEVPVIEGELETDHLLIRLTPAAAAELGVSARPRNRDPSTCWVPVEQRGLLQAHGIESLDAREVIVEEIAHAAHRRARDLLGLQETQQMLDQLERAYPAVVRNVVPKPISLALLTDVLRRLVEEGVSIRPLREILEALATYAVNERDPITLTELVRANLKRQITYRYARDGSLWVMMLDPAIEEAVRDAIQRTPNGSYLAMAPDLANEILQAMKHAIKEHAVADRPTLLLTQADVRRFVRRLVESELPDLQVLSYQELAPEVHVQPLTRIEVGGL